MSIDPNSGVSAIYNQTMSDLDSNASADQLREDAYAFLVASRGGQEPGTANRFDAIQSMDFSLNDGSFYAPDAKTELKTIMTLAAKDDEITATPSEVPLTSLLPPPPDPFTSEMEQMDQMRREAAQHPNPSGS